MPFTIDGSTGFLIPDGADISLTDDDKLQLGTGNDLQIYHDGATNNSYIKESGTGHLIVQGQEIQFDNASGTSLMNLSATQIEMLHNGTKVLETTSNGIDVTGVGTNFKSATYNILNLQTDTNNDGTSDDGIFKITNGSAGTTKAEFRWDESEDAVQIAYGDHGRHIVIKSSGRVGVGTTSPNDKLHIEHSDTGTYSASSLGTGMQISRKNSSNTNNQAVTLSLVATGWEGITTGLAGISAVQPSNTSSADLVFQNRSGGGYQENMRIKFDGAVGIGETNPENILHIKTSAAGGPQIELDSTSGTANSAFINFDGTSLQLSTQRDMVDGSKRDTAKSWGGINIVGAAAGSYIQLQTSSGNNNAVSTRMTVDKDGNVGIGTDSPSYKLDVDVGAPGSTDQVLGRFSSQAGTRSIGYVWDDSASTLGIATLTNHKMVFHTNGNSNPRMTIGNGSVAENVLINGDTADHTGTGGGSKGLSLATAGGTSVPLYFGTETNSAQKSMYMNGYWIYIRGHQNEGVRFVFSQGGGTAIRSDQYQFKYNSATRPTGNTTWDGFSDSRAKENVQTLTNALDTIGQLRPVTFDWTDDYADRMNMFEMDTTDEKTYNHFSVKENGYDLDRKTAQIGFIAQEFETVFPKSITEQELELGDTTIQDFKTVNYDHLIPTLTKAIQELKAENDALRARLDAAGL